MIDSPHPAVGHRAGDPDRDQVGPGRTQPEQQVGLNGGSQALPAVAWEYDRVVLAGFFAGSGNLHLGESHHGSRPGEDSDLYPRSCATVCSCTFVGAHKVGVPVRNARRMLVWRIRDRALGPGVRLNQVIRRRPGPVRHDVTGRQRAKLLQMLEVEGRECQHIVGQLITGPGAESSGEGFAVSSDHRDSLQDDAAGAVKADAGGLEQPAPDALPPIRRINSQANKSR